MSVAVDMNRIEALNAMEPEEILAWAESAHGERAAILTSFQNTGCVMIDMASRVAPALRIVTVDPLRLHQETYDFIAAIEKRYGITVERFTPDPKRLQRMISQHGEYLFFDSKEKQEHCCWVRKVEPNQRALATLDVWISGLRRD
ncbi:MAG: phosphoadenosine phosphosulfate reductase family protein, partial [Candidatus Hydrogenedentes bacterium]|nr:phosphoadenosine phosphosulfate reductase family protein [Candidatus Hydrogenedentota bacterium]